MLVIPVYSDYPGNAGPVLHAPGEGGFHGPALAPVYRVGEDRHLRVLGCIQKRLQVLRGAAVVYQKYILKPLLQQPLHHQHELLIRVQGGDDHGYVHG